MVSARFVFLVGQGAPAGARAHQHSALPVNYSIFEDGCAELGMLLDYWLEAAPPARRALTSRLANLTLASCLATGALAWSLKRAAVDKGMLHAGQLR